MSVNTRPSLSSSSDNWSKDQQSEQLTTSDHLGATLSSRKKSPASSATFSDRCLHWEQIDGELVIVRVDQLSVVGEENTTPIGVILLDAHRLVDGKPVPFRVRHFRLGKVVRGAEFTITELKLNDSVDVPERVVIPEGSPVRNFMSGKLYRQPADKTTIDP